MMERDSFSETSVFTSILTRLIAREDFIAFIRRESFKTFEKVLDYSLYTKFRLRDVTFLLREALDFYP
jgi:hypothetical protein